MDTLRADQHRLLHDNRAESHCSIDSRSRNQPTGLTYGGCYARLPPDQGDNWTHYYHGALYSDPRISAYIGMGLHQMPGNVWWRSWRELPRPSPDCRQRPGSRGGRAARQVYPSRVPQQFPEKVATAITCVPLARTEE